MNLPGRDQRSNTLEGSESFPGLAQDLEDASGQLVKFAEAKDTTNMIKEARKVAHATIKLVKLTNQRAEMETVDDRKKKLMEAAHQVQVSTAALAKVAKTIKEAQEKGQVTSPEYLLKAHKDLQSSSNAVLALVFKFNALPSGKK